MRQVGCLKPKKKWGNYRKLFVFVATSCAHFRNSGVCNSMTTKSAIEKLQKIAREKEA